MIQCALMFNEEGHLRMMRFYDGTPHDKQLEITSKIYEAVCAGKESTSFQRWEHGGKDLKLVYRCFTTLYVAFIVDSNESELGILDFMQVFVRVLEQCFDNVCEIDIVYNFEKINYVLDEMIQGGIAMETNAEAVYEAIKV